MNILTQPAYRFGLLVLLFLGSAWTYAQTVGIPYQAYFTDKNSGYIPGDQVVDVPLSYTDLKLRFEILDDTQAVLYTEDISAKTDEFGLLSTVVGAGRGTVVSGDFANIIWDGSDKILQIYIDFSNTGSQYEKHGTLDLVYIPGPSLVKSKGLSSAAGAPTASYPEDPVAGDIYVDEATGDIYTHDGSSWASAGGGAKGTGDPSGNVANPVAGDIYVDESTGHIFTYDSTTSSWTNRSEVVSATADNLIKHGADGLAHLSNADIGVHRGTGAPGAHVSSPNAGDLYVDDATGHVYTHDGTSWTNRSEVVSATADNLIGHGGDGLAHLSTSDIGLYQGVGTPATNVASPSDGDIYVDQDSGSLFVYTGSAWAQNVDETLTALAIVTNDNGTPADTSDDFDELIYTDERGTKNAVDIRTLLQATNGLSATNGVFELGGVLNKPTILTTSATNTLAVAGLTEETAFDTAVDQLVVMDPANNVLKRTKAEQLVTQKQSLTVANDGDTDFATPMSITDMDKIDVYRNGIRVGFSKLDDNTIRLEADATCHAGDEIRIVQLN
jgi:hypothetical protein